MIEYHCPECFHIPIYEIDDNFESLKIKCINNHLFEFKISEFFLNNPFQKSKIQCTHCSSIENSIYNLYYCIQCKAYTCQNDLFNHHKKCTKVISLEQIVCTCLDHNSPYIKLCKNCNKEICTYCIIKGHHNHLLSEEKYNIIEKINFLKRNKPIEQDLIEMLISKNENLNKGKSKKIYDNLMKMLNFCENIYSNELLNQRYSNILFVNVFKSYHSLNKFKRSLIPPIRELFKKIDDNEIYTLLESLIPSLKYSKEMIVNNSKNIFLIQTTEKKDFILFSSEAFLTWDIVKKNKIEEIKILANSLTFEFPKDTNSPIKYQILGKVISEKLNNNNSEKNESINNDIFSPYCPLFNFFKNIGNNMIDFLSYEDLVFNLNEKKNIFHQKNKIKNNNCIILDNGYILLLLNYYDLYRSYEYKGMYDFKETLILISPDNQYKQILAIDSKLSINFWEALKDRMVPIYNIYSIYKNYFMITNYEYMYLFL